MKLPVFILFCCFSKALFSQTGVVSTFLNADNQEYIVSQSIGQPFVLMVDSLDYSTCEGVQQPNWLKSKTPNEWTLSPNPGRRYFEIRRPTDNLPELVISIYNALGQLILEIKSSEPVVLLDLGAAASGIYYARIQSSTNDQVIKFIHL